MKYQCYKEIRPSFLEDRTVEIKLSMAIALPIIIFILITKRNLVSIILKLQKINRYPMKQDNRIICEESLDHKRIEVTTYSIKVEDNAV